jgi:hypothetical protein
MQADPDTIAPTPLASQAARAVRRGEYHEPARPAAHAESDYLRTLTAVNDTPTQRTESAFGATEAAVLLTIRDRPCSWPTRADPPL